MSEDQLVQETTDILLDAVHKILDLGGVGPRIVESAMIVYECVNESGRATVDYVVSNTLSLTNTIGLADFIREHALTCLLDDE